MPTEIHKTIRWNQFVPRASFDHQCSKLPESMKFHKFKFELTADQRRAFGKKKQLELRVTCPHCGAICVYDVVNTRH